MPSVIVECFPHFSLSDSAVKMFIVRQDWSVFDMLKRYTAIPFSAQVIFLVHIASPSTAWKCFEFVATVVSLSFRINYSILLEYSGTALFFFCLIQIKRYDMITRTMPRCIWLLTADSFRNSLLEMVFVFHKSGKRPFCLVLNNNVSHGKIRA